jgi:hypothetical protein
MRIQPKEPAVAAKSAQPKRSESQIVSDLDATRERLTTSVETLIDQVHPNRVKQRGTARLKVVLGEYTEKAKSLVFNARGDLRTNRLAAVGGGIAGFATFVAVIRRLRNRKKS